MAITKEELLVPMATTRVEFMVHQVLPLTTKQEYPLEHITNICKMDQLEDQIASLAVFSIKQVVLVVQPNLIQQDNLNTLTLSQVKRP